MVINTKTDNQLLSSFRKKLSENFFTLLISIFIFVFHFIISYRNSLKTVDNDAIAVIVLTVKDLYQSGSFSPWLSQVNFYTGNPFFMTPYFLIFESSPFSLRIALIGMMASASVFAFLSYRNLFGYKKGLIGVLLLLNINTWLLFRRADYAYLTLFPIICLYLFSRWDTKRDNTLLYAMSFISAILFYIKAVVAFTMISLVLGKLIAIRTKFANELYNELDLRSLGISLGLFLIGLLPFIKHLLTSRREIETGANSFFNSQSTNLLENLTARLSDLTSLIDPLTAFNTQDPVFAVNSISVILVVSIVVSLAYRRNVDYTLAFLLFFSSLLLLPQGSGLRYGHLMPLMPFIPLIALTSYEVIEEKIRKSQLCFGENLLYLIILFALVFNISASVAWIEHMEVLRTEPLPAGRAPAGDADLRENKINLNENVVTNSYDGALYSLYDFNVENVFFVGDEIELRGDHLWSDKREWNLKMIALYKFNVHISKPNRLTIPENTTFLLASDPPCPNGGCYSAGYLEKKFNLNQSVGSVKIDKQKHTFYETTN